MTAAAPTGSFQFRLNGELVTASGHSSHTSLLDFVHARGLTGAKEGCAEGECGACAVAIVKNCEQGSAYRAVNSCLMYLPMVAGQEVYTVEGLAQNGQLIEAQQAMIQHGGSQCGYCTPGFVVSLFTEQYRPGRTGLCDLEELSGNLCRCTGYRPIRDAALSLGPAPADIWSERLEKVKAIKVGDGSESGVEMGPVVTSDHAKKILGYIEKGVQEGAKPLCDGREGIPKDGFFVGPTIFDEVTPGMTIAREEIFGPVLSVIRARSLDDAIGLVNSSAFGNTTSIFTSNGKSAREYQSQVEVGMVGVNIGVAAPMAFFPFAGWKASFFGDLHAHGKDAIGFYTEQKVLMTRWF